MTHLCFHPRCKLCAEIRTHNKITKILSIILISGIILLVREIIQTQF
jgi:hypothetical protein